MTDKVKQLAPKIWEEIQKANHILLSFHRGPDGDSFGSNLALFHLLKNLGKNVTVIKGDSVLSQSLKAFPGFEMVIPKNIFEIDLPQFDLFIFVDGSNLDQLSRLGKVIFPENLTVVAIDHHENNTVPAQISLVDSSYPAVGQMLFDLFKLWKAEITPEIAICLFLGIYTDSLFKYPGTTAETFLAAAQLVKIYPNFPQSVHTLEDSLSPNQLVYWSLSLAQIKYPFSRKIALSAISFDQLKGTKIPSEIVSTSAISEILRSVSGVEISVAMAEKEKGVVSVSFRSFVKDVSKIALVLGGGGHAGAGGTIMNLSLAEAEKKVLEELQKLYPELGGP